MQQLCAEMLNDGNACCMSTHLKPSITIDSQIQGACQTLWAFVCDDTKFPHFCLRRVSP